MTDEVAEESNPLAQADIGQRLRAAREAAGFTVEKIAAQTRIQPRHIAAIEECNFAALPGRTYAVGFARSYAKVLGMDGEAAAHDVRRLLDDQLPDQPPRPATFEPGDPARVPSISLGWISAGAVLVLIVAGFFLLPRLFAPAVQLPSLLEAQEAEQAAAAAAARAAATPVAGATVAAGGAVVFTAVEEGIWVKFYDAGGRQLMQKQMAKGETYAVPADAEGPQLWTARPEALTITIGGKAVPPIAAQQRTVKDVPVTAAALLARPAAGAQPAPSPVANAAAD